PQTHLTRTYDVGENVGRDFQADSGRIGRSRAESPTYVDGWVGVGLESPTYVDIPSEVPMSMASPEETRSYPIERLAEFSERVFRHFGVPEPDARQAADVLAASDPRGIDSHGVARLRPYFDMLTLGPVNPTPRIPLVR